jgi:outer membrane protein OmpU
MGIINTESTTNARDWKLQTEVDLSVAMSGSTDNGLTFGADFGISADTAAGIEDHTVFISGAFGKLSMGADVPEANKNGGIADIGYDGLGVDDVVEGNRNGAAANIHYSYSINGLTFGVSAGTADQTSPVETPVAYGVAYTMGALSMNVGYASDDDTGVDTTYTSLGVNYKANGLTINSLYTRQEATGATDIDAIGVSVGYAIDDATTMTVAFADSDADTQESFGVGVDYSLGGGATVSAGVASVNDISKSSVGISFSF